MEPGLDAPRPLALLVGAAADSPDCQHAHQDIIEADKPKPSALGGPPGVTVIEHTPDSEAGQELLQLDQIERERIGDGSEVPAP